MKHCWTLLVLAILLQTCTVSVLAGHHGHGSNIAHILAAGLIVQLLAGKNHHHGHHHHGHHQGRHSGADIQSDLSPFGKHDPFAEEHRAMTPEATLSSSSWAQRAPMDIGYSHTRYSEPVMESYNTPYYNSGPFNYPYQYHSMW